MGRVLGLIRQRTLADERGSILLLLALALPVIILLLAMSLDFGNWYAHKRQLQNRVDAGALAAGVAYGTEFAGCTSTNPGTRAAAETAIGDAAKQFAGDPTLTTTSNVFNTAPGDSSEGLIVAINDGNTAQGPCFLHPAGGPFPSPNGGYWTDVNAVAAEVPSFFSGFGVPKPRIAASARVALMTPESGMRPLVLADPAAATCVTAQWSSGNQSGSVPLSLSGSNWVGNAPSWPSGNSDMIIGVRVGCTNARTYSNMAYVTRLPSGSGSPQLQSLAITPTNPGTCTNENPYFIPRDGSPCQMRLTATFGAAVAAARVQVGNGGFQALTGSGTTWSLNFTINPGAGTGPNRTQPILVQARTGSGSFVDKGRASVQAGRAFNQGPIANVTVASHAPPNAGSIGAIAVTLRTLGSSGLIVIDAGVDCEPGGGPNPSDSFALGCSGPFMISTNPSGCDNSASTNAPNAAGPFDCVGGIGNGTLNSLENDYDDLWAPGNNCTRNNWPNVPTGDPRLVTVFLTDGIPDTQNASDDYRVTGFAAFYVTGWDDAPGSCGSSGTNGQNDPEPDDTPNGGLWGHVVPDYVILSSDGTASDVPCTSGSVCIAALVK